jgi:hypothetical protein
MKNHISKLLLLGAMSQSISLATAMDLVEQSHTSSLHPSTGYALTDVDYEKREFPLISPLMVEYFKETAKRVKSDKMVNLNVSLAGIYGGETFDLPLQLQSSDIPAEPFTKEYVLSLSPLLSTYLDDLKSRKEPKAIIRVSMYLEGLPAHREKVNGFDTIEFN